MQTSFSSASPFSEPSHNLTDIMSCQEREPLKKKSKTESNFFEGDLFSTGCFYPNYEISQTSMNFNELSSFGNTHMIKHNPSKSDFQATSQNYTNDLMMQRLKQKISVQAKRLTELQLYINICESALKQVQPNIQLPIKEEDIPHFQNQIELVQTLNQQILANEEQKNYIEMLKDTLDSTIIKSGFSDIINEMSKKNEYNNSIRYLLDLSKLKDDKEKISKNLILEKAMLDQMKNEIDSLKNENENLNEKLQEQISQNKSKENETNENIKQIKIENESNKNKIKELNVEIKQQKGFINDYQTKCSKLEIEILNLKFYKDNFEELQGKYKDLDKENLDLKEENRKYKNNMNNNENFSKEKMEIEELKKSIETYKDNLQHSLNQIQNLQNDMENLRQANAQLTNDNQLKATEILNNLAKLDSQEEQIKILKSELLEKQSQNDNENQEVQSKYSITLQNLKNSNIEKKQLKFLYDNAKIELQKKEEEITSLKSDNSNLQKKIESVSGNNKKINREKEKLNKQIKSTAEENTTRSREYDILKDKYEKLRNEKYQYEKEIVKELEETRVKYAEIKKMYLNNINENQKITNDLETINSQHKQLQFENSNLKKNNESLLKKLEKNVNELKEQIKNNHELLSQKTNFIQNNQLLQQELDQCQKDKTSLQLFNSLYTKKFESLKENSIQKELNMYTMQTNKEALNKYIDASIKEIDEFLKKFKKYILCANNNANYGFTTFSEFLDEFPSNIKNLNSIEKLKIIENFIFLIGTQIDILFVYVQSLYEKENNVSRISVYTNNLCTNNNEDVRKINNTLNLPKYKTDSYIKGPKNNNNDMIHIDEHSFNEPYLNLTSNVYNPIETGNSINDINLTGNLIGQIDMGNSELTTQYAGRDRENRSNVSFMNCIGKKGIEKYSPITSHRHYFEKKNFSYSNFQNALSFQGKNIADNEI